LMLELTLEPSSRFASAIAISLLRGVACAALRVLHLGALQSRSGRIARPRSPLACGHGCSLACPPAVHLDVAGARLSAGPCQGGKQPARLGSWALPSRSAGGPRPGSR